MDIFFRVEAQAPGLMPRVFKSDTFDTKKHSTTDQLHFDHRVKTATATHSPVAIKYFKYLKRKFLPKSTNPKFRLNAFHDFLAVS